MAVKLTSKTLQHIVSFVIAWFMFSVVYVYVAHLHALNLTFTRRYSRGLSYRSLRHIVVHLQLRSSFKAPTRHADAQAAEHRFATPSPSTEEH